MTAAAIVCWSPWSRRIPRSCATRPATTPPRRRRCGAGTGWRCGARAAGFLRVYDHRHERPGYIRPTHRARPPAGARRARRSWRRWSASCATPTAASRWGSATRRWRCARRRPAPTPARSWRRSARWPTGWRGGRRRGAPTRATRRWPAHIEVAESYGVNFKSVDARRRARSARRARALLRRRGLGARAGARRRGAGRAGAGGAVRWRVDALPGSDDAGAAPARRGAWNDRRLQALQSIDYPVEAALPAGLAAGACGCAAPRRSPGGRSTRPAAATSTPAARAEAAAVARAGADRSRRARARGSRTSTRTSPMRVAASRWATEAGAEAGAASAASTSSFAPRAPRRDLRARRPDERPPASARPRRALHLRRRLAERAALGAVGDVATHRRPAAGRRGPSSGSCAGGDRRTRWTIETPDRPRRPIPTATSATSRRPGSRPTAAACWSCARRAPAARSPGASRCWRPPTLAVEKLGGARRQAGRVQALELALVARRNAGAAMKGVDAAAGSPARDRRAVGCQLVLD